MSVVRRAGLGGNGEARTDETGGRRPGDPGGPHPIHFGDSRPGDIGGARPAEVAAARTSRGRRVRLPRGIRARLTASYTLAATLLILAGAAVFLFALTRGLQANLDNDLSSRADTLATVLSTEVAFQPPPVSSVPSVHGGDPETVDAYRSPDGALFPATSTPLPDLVVPPRLAASKVGAQALGSVKAGRSEYRLVVIPVRRDDGVWLAIAGASRQANDEAIDEVTRGLLIAGPVLLLLVAVGTWLLGGAALRPVDRMRRDAAALSSQPGAGRLRVPDTDDELAALASTLNEMLERLQRSLTRQRSLVSDAGHELRTPLAVLRTELELADRPGRTREELAEAVSYAAVEADRLSQLADDLLFLARADEGEPLVRLQPTDVSALLCSAARAFRNRAEAADVELVVDVPDELPALADSAALRRAVDNVLANALEHSHSGGEIRLSAALLDEGGPLLISVSDNGPGFPDEFLPHAFERFRRADAARRHGNGHAGTGLGLAIVAEVAAAHGGHARAGNCEGGGASVELELPLRPST
jgi:two-component system, OmpR family, sensor kinase